MPARSLPVGASSFITSAGTPFWARAMSIGANAVMAATAAIVRAMSVFCMAFLPLEWARASCSSVTRDRAERKAVAATTIPFDSEVPDIAPLDVHHGLAGDLRRAGGRRALLQRPARVARRTRHRLGARHRRGLARNRRRAPTPARHRRAGARAGLPRRQRQDLFLRARVDARARRPRSPAAASPARRCRSTNTTATSPYARSTMSISANPWCAAAMRSTMRATAVAAMPRRSARRASARRGLWAGTFETPATWRQQNANR